MEGGRRAGGPGHLEVQERYDAELHAIQEGLLFLVAVGWSPGHLLACADIQAALMTLTAGNPDGTEFTQHVLHAVALQRGRGWSVSGSGSTRRTISHQTRFSPSPPPRRFQKSFGSMAPQPSTPCSGFRWARRHLTHSRMNRPRVASAEASGPHNASFGGARSWTTPATTSPRREPAEPPGVAELPPMNGLDISLDRARTPPNSCRLPATNRFGFCQRCQRRRSM